MSITSAAGGTEGSNVTFTVSANPAPTADLAVSATVATVGDYGVTAGPRTVTIAGGTSSKTLTLPTTDDSTDEADGSVTLTLNGGSGYTVGQFSSETAQIQDDDDAPQQQQPATYTVDPALIAEVQAHIDAFTARNHPAGIRDWNLILDRLEGRTGMSDAKIAAWLADSKTPWLAGRHRHAAQGAGGIGGNGGAADPADAAAHAGGEHHQRRRRNRRLQRDVHREREPPRHGRPGGERDGGDRGRLRRDRRLPHGDHRQRRYQPDADAADDGRLTDEANGSVTLTLNGGSGYTVGQLSSETAQVQDDDEPQQQQQPVVIPVVSVTGGNGVTEGGNASFTVTANPAPTSALSVSVTVSASGDYGATTGARTVTIPTGGSATFTVATTNDGTTRPTAPSPQP